MKKKRTQGKANIPAADVITDRANVANKIKKRARSDNNEETSTSKKSPTQTAVQSDLKNKSARLFEKTKLVGRSKVQIVEEESMAIDLTASENVPRPNRRLTDFIFHNADGEPQPVEMMECKDMFISGLILPLEETSDKEKESGIQCNAFGRIESWAISGYEDGSPVIWVSTDIADYDCLKPAGVYKKLYGQFYEKARACIEIYKRLSISSGGHPDLTLDELLAAVLRSMSGSKHFPTGSSIKELVLSWGEFIYEQLTGLDGENFDQLPVLAALREESKRKADDPSSEKALSGEEQNNKSEEVLTQPTNPAQETLEKGDLKLARLLQENNDWKTLRQNKKQRHTNSTSKFYIRINEAEIANDYPLPAYYESTTQETDEYIICDCSIDVHDPDMLPRNMLHDWSLYNSDFRLMSLEVIPMTPCSDIDVTVFGSGIMTNDDGSGFYLDAESASNPSGSLSEDGIPVFLSAIKEWMIEFGSSMVFITIRTDMGWYRLGKPAKEYAPWYEPVLKTARLSISIITLLKVQSRVSRLTFKDVIKRVAEYEENHPAYISNNATIVERYIVVHGQIILQQFSEYPDANIRRCAFVSGLQNRMEERSHTRLLVRKRKIEEKARNLNPRGAMEPIVSKRKAMPATTTRLINLIWGDYYSNYLADETEEDTHEAKKDGELEEENEEEEIENATEDRYETEQPNSISKPKKSHLVNTETKWEGGVVGRTSACKPLYKEVSVRGDVVALSGSVLVETGDSAEYQSIYFVEYMYEESDGSKWIHGRLMLRACETVLGNTGNDREVFLSTKCMDFEVEDIAKPVVVEIRKMFWGHQHRKANANIERNDRLRVEDWNIKDPLEYFCKSMYCSDRGAFVCLPTDSMGLGKGVCQSCKINDSKNEKKLFKLNKSLTSFRYHGTEFHGLDYLYVAPHYLKVDEKHIELFRGGRNIGLKAYIVCQFLEIEVPDSSKQDSPEYVTIKLRRFFRPEDISSENAYSSDIREVYYSDQIMMVPIVAVEGKCEVRRRQDVSVYDGLYIFEHIFFCDQQYDPQSGELKHLPIHIKLSGSQEKVLTDAKSKKKKGKLVNGKAGSDSSGKQQDADPKKCLATLDIFAGCGGLSEGLQKSGASITKWAIEYEEPTGEAYNLNHPDAATVVNNCNVILRAIMTASGDEDDCISTSDAAEKAAKLDETELKKLPKPGQVDFINGGPPCQGFSGLNRFNHSTWSKVQCEMILAFLSFVEYFRPKFFLLENVRNFVSFNKGQTFRLTLASLLAMGYQVRFGILEAGAYGVSQSRKRAFIWAASPEEILPEWPEPMHVFAGPELKIPLSKGVYYAAARSTASGAPYRAITVKDTIGDLPAVGNGASATTMEYKSEPVSWFQKRIRGESMVLTDHISKEMNELNHMRCRRIPKRPGADWRDLPDEKVRLTNGQIVDLIPWCLPNTAERHNQWKGLFGRLDWEGNFPTSVTDPQPMGKVAMCFHPDQDRILTVRECARSQGFLDSYKFSGNIHNKHRQIGNAVPPPLAFALGRKLKEAIDNKST